MAVQPGLCVTWSETPKTSFLTTRLKWDPGSEQQRLESLLFMFVGNRFYHNGNLHQKKNYINEGIVQLQLYCAYFNGLRLISLKVSLSSLVLWCGAVVMVENLCLNFKHMIRKSSQTMLG